MGLGMCIVKYIVEVHQGEIWVESVIGEGTTAYVFLPIPDFNKLLYAGQRYVYSLNNYGIALLHTLQRQDQFIQHLW